MSDSEPEDDDAHAECNPRYFRRALRLRCPICGQGRLFRGLTMVEECPVCGFHFEREPGYWTNAATLNYMLTGGLILILIVPIVALDLPLPVTLAIGVGLAVLLPLLCFRHIKALWLAFDLRIRPPTTFERLSGFLHVSRSTGSNADHPSADPE